MNEGDKAPPRNSLSRKWTAAAVLLTVPVFFAVAYFVGPARGRAASISVVVLVVAAGVSWNLRGEAWYRLTIALLAGCHIPLIMFVPWTDKSYPGYALLPIAVLDFAIVMTVIRLVERAASARGD